MGCTGDWSQRPTYSPEQINKYFDRIKLPAKYRQSPVVQTSASSIDEETALSFLKILERYQVAAVPFENLSLHYSVQRHISIEAQKHFEKIVDKSERGGYCMENSTLFGTVLRSLGYQVTSVGGRVNEAAQPMSASTNWRGPKYDGWNHMVNLVTIGEQKYLIDVGFGSNGPHQPVPLTHDFEFHNVVTSPDACAMDQSPNIPTGPKPFGNMRFEMGAETETGSPLIASLRPSLFPKISP